MHPAQQRKKRAPKPQSQSPQRMRSTGMKQESQWTLGSMPAYPALSQDTDTTVLIIGGGITGLTAACLLSQEGKKVVLLEKHRLGSAETLHTTAHISYPSDLRLTDLEKHFGASHAQAVWEAGQAAAHEIVRLVREEKIDCGLQSVPAYLYAAEGSDLEKESGTLKQEAERAQELGFDTAFLSNCPAAHRPALAFANLHKFHPMEYLKGLAEAATRAGAVIHEESEVTEFGESGHEVTCKGVKVHFKHVFIATHVPLQGNASTLSAAMLQTKLAGYSTYAVSARLSADTAVPEALWWDTADPYFYFRTDRDEQGVVVIAGGEDHKTGTVTDTESCYTRLILKLHHVFPCARVEKRWSGQVIETADGLPYIGETKGQFIATGYSGTGMTFGTLAAMMFRDHVLRVANPWADLFAPERKKLSATWDYLKENKDYPYYLVKGLLQERPDGLAAVAKGEGTILRHDGKKTAAYRDEDGKLTLLSPTCPHLGCTVGWNEADKTWDCPCHGSRFTATGQVMAGPAESPLAELNAQGEQAAKS